MADSSSSRASASILSNRRTSGRTRTRADHAADANGMLVVKVDPSGVKGMAEWEVISAQDRTAEYDRRQIPAGHSPRAMRENVRKKAASLVAVAGSPEHGMAMG
jgi:hypothetical protein